MSTVVLVQAQPRLAATGALVDVRLAGGGTRPYTQLGYSDWRSGIANLPRFTAALGFDQTGWTGGALPQTGGIRYATSDRAWLTQLANLNWIGARIVVSIGDDEAVAPAYPTQLVGEVAAIKVDAGALTLTISDLSADLNKPVAPDTFAGTGGLEGGDDATGRVKRRTWGYAFNVEGRLLDKAYSIYEFGDPNRPLNAFPMVKDKGREAGSYVDVAWQGSAAATLTALRNAAAPSGGCARAPSIACVKWWTTPAGPLTADVKGEVGAGYVETPPSIAARIVSVYSALVVVGNVAEANGWQSASAGVHVDTASENVGDLLDRLLLPVSIAWVLGGDGVLSFRRFTWAGPVETIAAQTIEREVTFKPLKTRRVGFQRNHRQHTDAEISATLLLASDATYADGTPIETLKPTDPGATAGATWGGNVSNRPNNLAELAGAEGIRNGLVSISAGGAISGAGGGQVTIGGLGYGGDLDAQRNSRILVSGGILSGIGTGNVTVDNSKITISGGYLSNGVSTINVAIGNSLVSIAQNGALTGAGGGQVTIGGLGYLGDLAASRGIGLIPNGDAERGDTAGFLIPETTGNGGTAAAVTDAPISGRYSFRLAKAAAADGLSFLSRAIPVRPGDQLLAMTDAFGSTATATGLYVQVMFHTSVNSDGFLDISSATRGSAYNPAENVAFTTTVQHFEKTVTAPAGVSFAAIMVSNWAGGTLDARFDNINLQRLVPWANGVGLRPSNLAALMGGEAINNVGISISAGGSLAGGGGGQVTFSGLGGGAVGLLATVDLAGSYASGTLPTARASTGLINVNVSIGANGVLSGGGGGQVSLTGLGAGSLATKSAVGSVDILADSITGSKIAFGDKSNLIADPTLIDPSCWGGFAAAGATLNPAPSNSGYASANYLRLPVSSSQSGVSSKAFPVEGGNPYFLRVIIAAANGPQTAWTGFLWYRDPAGTDYLGETVVGQKGHGPFVDAATARNQAVVTAPAGAMSARIHFTRGAGGPSTVDYAEPIVRRAASYDLLTSDAVRLGGNVRDESLNLLASSGTFGVRNSVLSISASGVLSGGGGGQVTIGGLGFGGDLDAQRNTRITIDSGGALQGIGSGGGAAVANYAITISGTTLNGIGTGTGTSVVNAGITISASGALSGGGGGQVTIRGIGYGGDLNAGSTLNLYNSNPANLYAITGNTVTAGPGSGQWNNNAFSREIAVNSAYISCRHLGISYVGLTTNRVYRGDGAEYLAVDAYWFYDGNGTYYPQMGGGTVGPSRAGGAGGQTLLINDGTAWIWYYNGAFVCSVASPPNLVLAAGFGIGTPGAVVDNVQFGSYSDNAGKQNLVKATGRAVDSRLLNASNAFGLRSLSQPPGFSASIANGAATITLDGNGVYYTDWSATISLPSASFPGLAYSTMYYFWRNMPVDGAGTSYGYSTDLTQALGTGKSYFGNYTTPSSGGTGGGGGTYGGENCVAADAWVPTLNRGTIRARDVREGDLLRVLSESLGGVTWAPCTGASLGRNDCCRMLGEGGARLTLAINTPITLRDGTWIVAANAWGREVGHLFALDDEAPAWLTLPDVEGIGELEVARLSCGDGTYAAGDDREGPFLFSHNLRPQKP